MSKYTRTILGFCGTEVEVDVYRVIDAFDILHPQLQHAVKKIMACGQRGHKDFLTDVADILASVENLELRYRQTHGLVIGIDPAAPCNNKPGQDTINELKVATAGAVADQCRAIDKQVEMNSSLRNQLLDQQATIAKLQAKLDDKQQSITDYATQNAHLRVQLQDQQHCLDHQLTVNAALKLKLLNQSGGTDAET